jgi:hypothetical protein
MTSRCAVVLSVALITSCVPVAAWQRERLAHPAMQDTPRAECAAFDGHVRGARETALDPSASGGGGCGCN